MNSFELAISTCTGTDEIDRLYDELNDDDCSCAYGLCTFHQKLIRLKDLQSREISEVENRFRRLRLSLSRNLSLLASLDDSLSDVLK
jgi:hypothetical protein